MEYLDLTDLARLYRSGAIEALDIMATGSRYQVRVELPDRAALLSDGRRDNGAGVLAFDSIELATAFLREQGLDDCLQTDESWIHTKVQASIDGLKDGSNRVYSESEWAALRRAKKTAHGA